MGAINCREKKKPSETHERIQSGAVTSNSTTSSSMGLRKFCSDTMSSAQFVEKVVCKENEIQDGEMKQFDINEDSKVLLVKQNGRLHALGTKCTHYGAPLHTGVLGEGHVRCPWHGACFSLETGDIEEFPGLDSLPCHQVSVKDGEVKVRARSSDLENDRRLKTMVKRDPANNETFVIIGGGPSGGVCVETLRQEGFTGRIVLLCREKCLPYDRIKLTKAMDTPVEALEFRKNDFYTEYGIEPKIGIEAVSVDTCLNKVQCSDGEEIKYDKLYIATGCKPIRPTIPGAELENIFTVREHEDAVKILTRVSPEAEVVCLGSSFIALEVAAYLVSKVKKVTVVGRSPHPLEVGFGKEVGERVKKLFEDNGVVMTMSSGIVEFKGNDKSEVTSAKLKDGKEIPCTLCVLGVGSGFNTDFLKDSGVILNGNGSIDTDPFLRTNVKNVYIGGDIAHAPIGPVGSQKATIGHYQLAQYHGRVAGLNMAGNETQLKTVPYFWTMLFGKNFRYAGYGKSDKTRIFGSLDELKFVAVYYDAEGDVIAMASCMRDPVVSKFADIHRDGSILTSGCFNEETLSWPELSLRSE